MINRFSLILFLLTIGLFFQNVLAQEQTAKINFSVVDKHGKFVSGLKTSDFKILSNKKNLEINLLKESNEKPLELAILIDASASQEKMIPFEKQIAESFINNVLINGKDKVGIIKFSDKAVLVQNLTDNLSEVKTKLSSIEFEPPAGYVGGGIMVGNTKTDMTGSTSIWDSLKSVIEGFSKMKKNDSRRIVLLISDGVNTLGKNKLKETIDVSVKNQIPVYAVGIGDENYDGVDKNTLNKITEETGGILVLPKKKLTDLPEKITMLKEFLRSFYEAEVKENLVDKQEIKIEIINQEILKNKVKIIQLKY